MSIPEPDVGSSVMSEVDADVVCRFLLCEIVRHPLPRSPSASAAAAGGDSIRQQRSSAWQFHPVDDVNALTQRTRVDGNKEITHLILTCSRQAFLAETVISPGNITLQVGWIAWTPDDIARQITSLRLWKRSGIAEFPGQK